MLENKKISFFSAVLINVNIVIGSAFFLGAPDISQKAGFAAPFAWIACAALLLPLVMIFSKFASKYPTAGGIFVYSENELGHFWGYLGAWLYFVGTTAGNAMVLRSFATYLYQLGWVQQPLMAIGFSQLALEVILVIFFGWLSLRNVQIFERAQVLFSGLKMIPFAVLIIGAVMLFSPTEFVGATAFTPASMLGVMSTVLFAYIGIEACSAIIDKINDSKNQGFRVILTSFALIAVIYAVAQLLIVGIQGQSTDNPFLAILPKILSNQALIGVGNQIIYTAILFSFLGGFYGMFYVNSWNLFAMAQQRSIAGYSLWQRLNAQQAPWASVALQTAMLLIMLIAARSSSLLIVMGDLGVLLAYSLTTIAFMRLRPSLLGGAGIVAVGVLGAFLLQEVLSLGVMATLPFWVMFVIGLLIYRRSTISSH